MTATQIIKIFEILNAHFKNAEDARKVVSSIESVIEEKVSSQTETFEKIIHKDIDVLRSDMYKEFANVRTEIANSKTETLKWMIILFAPFYVGMIVFLVKVFMK